jgi:hypothetical protein
LEIGHHVLDPRDSESAELQLVVHLHELTP